MLCNVSAQEEIFDVADPPRISMEFHNDFEEKASVHQVQLLTRAKARPVGTQVPAQALVA